MRFYVRLAIGATLVALWVGIFLAAFLVPPRINVEPTTPTDLPYIWDACRDTLSAAYGRC